MPLAEYRRFKLAIICVALGGLSFSAPKCRFEGMNCQGTQKTIRKISQVTTALKSAMT